MDPAQRGPRTRRPAPALRAPHLQASGAQQGELVPSHSQATEAGRVTLRSAGVRAPLGPGRPRTCSDQRQMRGSSLGPSARSQAWSFSPGLCRSLCGNTAAPPGERTHANPYPGSVRMNQRTHAGTHARTHVDLERMQLGPHARTQSAERTQGSRNRTIFCPTPAPPGLRPSERPPRPGARRRAPRGLRRRTRHPRGRGPPGLEGDEAAAPLSRQTP